MSKEVMQQALDALVLCQQAGLHKHILNTGESLASVVNSAIEELAAPQPAPVQEPQFTRELCRRLYVELFHVNQQLTSIRDEDGDPMYNTGTTVRDVLHDAKTALDTPHAPPPQRQPLTEAKP